MTWLFFLQLPFKTGHPRTAGTSNSPSKLARMVCGDLQLPFKTGNRLFAVPPTPLQNWLLEADGASNSPSKLASRKVPCLQLPFKTGVIVGSSSSNSPSKLANLETYNLQLPFKTGAGGTRVPPTPLQNWRRRRRDASNSPSKLAS